MKGSAHFYKKNYNFSSLFADVHFDGKESEDNRRYDWEDELEIASEVEDVQVIKRGAFKLQGEKDGEAFSETIPDMLLFQFTDKKEEVTLMGCSIQIVDSYKIDKRETETILKVFLKEEEPLINPVAGIYIALKDFPEALSH